MGRFFKSFYFKISAILLALLVTMGALQAVLLANFFIKFGYEAEQLLNLDLADTLAAELLPIVTPTIDYPELQNQIFRFSQLFPRYDVYILDSEGKLRFYLKDRWFLKLDRVSLEPIKKLLITDARPTLPLFGDNPGKGGNQAIFSATRLEFGGEPGYLYVVLSNERNETVASVLRGSYLLMNSAAGLVLTVVVTAFVGLILFSLLTRRLKSMTQVVTQFDAGEMEKRIAVDSTDELGQLGSSFNRMADTILSNIEQLKATDKLRRDLVASISHDLRSPITSVRGYLDEVRELSEPIDWEKVQPAINIAYNNVRNLESLVSELFEYSKLEAKDTKPVLAPCSLTALCEWISLKFEPVAERFAVQIVTECPSDLPAVLADQALLERALSNLVENGIRYNRDGGKVVLTAIREREQILIAVRDTGVGIAPEDLPRIFDSFFRVDKSRSKDLPGTGLGLAIVKKIIEAHGAEIAVASVRHEGTTFSFALQVAPSA